MGSTIRKLVATIDDVLALSEDVRAELIRGSIVPKAAPTLGHSRAQTRTTATLDGLFFRSGGGPGGWLFFVELDVQFGGELFRPDICGYRRERLGQPLPTERPVQVIPDWICEVLSPSNEARDRVEKRETYFRFAVPHHWLLDPVEQTLEVYRRGPDAFVLVLAAHAGQTVRAEPFDAIELRVSDLLGVED